MEAKDVIFSMMYNQIRGLHSSILSALCDLLPNEGDSLEIDETEVTEDFSFTDYDGTRYAFKGFRRHGASIFLLGYMISDGCTIYRKTVYEKPSYAYQPTVLFDMVRSYDYILENRREKNGND